ncbi:hypothetical protein BDP27DRAFT_1430583 [Rhodocollybia butyracea]|uniref:Retrovirus-related Pol polyprotein from transposon TNT 1-94-like beta-barrel domain-containing protein n=1 Tax=Rhodocollybia butyracea TaxID=206335 RepID=A0A9P5TYP3_9AGAR|nr:hypothetical protein BDP27DRAFT_1430583 [Rhodocollybia butyracea]
MSTNNSKYDWKRITLTPIKENPDCTNNFAELKHKTTIKLEAHSLWKVQGLDTSGNAINITLQGNEPAVALAKQIHNDWLETDKHVLSLINDVVPIQKTWVIQKCKSSHDTWNALCKEFKPNNSLTAMNINQQISTFSCQPAKGALAVNNTIAMEIPDTKTNIDYSQDSPMDGDEEFTEVFETAEDNFAFMTNLRTEELKKPEDDLTDDEQVEVHPWVFNLQIPQTDFINHDTGATRHIFVHDFGSNLSATAIGKGTIVLKTTHNKITRQFSLSNVLHIPTARSNLILGLRLDKKGISTLSGQGKITYLSPKGTAFVSGEIIDDLYQMAVLPVKQSNNLSMLQDLIAAMAPSITTMVGPDSTNLPTMNLDFTTV